mgnify:CR=1 FL=1
MIIFVNKGPVPGPTSKTLGLVLVIELCKSGTICFSELIPHPDVLTLVFAGRFCSKGPPASCIIFILLINGFINEIPFCNILPPDCVLPKQNFKSIYSI